MELPIALDTALKALLSCHSVYSWKIAAEGQNPTVILRLRPETQPSAHENGSRVDTVTFKRKPPSQIHRDRRRAEEFKQRRDHVENTTVSESRTASKCENMLENEPNEKTIDQDPSENENKKGDSASQHTSRDSATDTAEHVARDGDNAETETAARGEGGGRGESDMETNNENDTESESDTEIKVIDTPEGMQPIIDIARELVENAESLQVNPDDLKQEDRNNTFDRVVLDWRCRHAPKLLCISDDMIATCYIEAGETFFEIRDPAADIYLPFWHFWPEVDRGGPHKEKIDNTRNKMKEVLKRIREMI